jgi:formylglycine-generating enzyme required for sulfatase activity
MRRISIIIISLLFASFFQAFAEESHKNQRFQVVSESIVFDSQSGLMWASQDNGKDIDWYDAKGYCEEFEAGGYTDWRLPDVKELATLYTEGKKGKSGYFITDFITITDCCPWSADENMGGAAIFSFNTGKKPAGFLADTYQLRALPVRSTKKMEIHE